MTRYKLIVSDCAWRYQNWSDKAHGAAVAHYEGMSCEELSAIPVERWADDDCIIAFWCSWPKLEEGITVLRAWGFTYVTGIPWVKTVPDVVEVDISDRAGDVLCGTLAIDGVGLRFLGKFFRRLVARIKVLVRRGVGFWTQSASEMLLIGRRGAPKRKGGREDNEIGLLVGEDRVFYHPIGKHSKKPEDIQSWLEKEFDGPRLELFARRERDGWACIGLDTGWILSARGMERIREAVLMSLGEARREREAAWAAAIAQRKTTEASLFGAAA